jgi:amino acid permease
MRRMFAVVWHYWLGVAMALGAVATVVALIAGYFKQVESGRYPRER